MQDETVKRRTRRDSGPGSRPYRRNGQVFTCQYCGKDFYRKASFIARGITKTCGDRECISKSMMKENNPYWGKEHGPEVREAMKASKSATPPHRKRRSGPPPDWKPTAEHRAAVSASLKRRWVENRDLMLSYIQRNNKPREDQRYRRNFTPWQRLNWKADKCAWCEATEDLTLDHIIPVMDDGVNIKENAQTLCHPCNLWKSHYVDRPSHIARLALQSGLVEG